MPRALIAMAAVGAVLLWTLNQASPVSSLEPASVLVASVQQQVFNAKTNTLYILDADRGEVAALDASTKFEQARIVVGGKPSALALNELANRILVLDAVHKRLTEIDTSTNTVVSAGGGAVVAGSHVVVTVPLGVLIAGPFAKAHSTQILLIGAAWALVLALRSGGRSLREKGAPDD